MTLTPPDELRMSLATRSSAVGGELRRLILSGELKPGERLRQVELARRFGVSTTPVREALSALARQGLVRADAQRGVVVFSPTVADVEENYAIRMALEPLATELATETVTDEQLERIDVILEEMRVAGSTAEYQAINQRFHHAIYAVAGRPRLLEIIDSLRDASTAYLQLDVSARPDPGYNREVHQQHEAIVAAIRRRAPRAAAKLMRQHLELNRRHIVASVELAQDRSPREL